jgi:hypothetical protein
MSRSDVRADADWVQAHLHAPGVVLVEVGEDTTAYDKGHLQGAVKLDWEDLQDPARCDQAEFEALLSELGIANDDMVILYSGNSWFAVYTYWYFRFYGHQSVRVLDGGRKKWERDSRKLVTDVPCRPRTPYRVRGPAEPRIATWPGLLTRGLWNAFMKPADQALRAASARVLAMLALAMSNHEDDILPHRTYGIDGRPHGIDGARRRDAESSIGFGPLIYIP